MAVQTPFDKIHLRLADETGDKQVARLMINLRRRADLLNPPLV